MVIRSEDYPNHDEQDDDDEHGDDEHDDDKHDNDKHDDDEHDEDEHADDQDDEADQGKEQEEGAGAREGGDGGRVLAPQASLGVSDIQTRSYNVMLSHLLMILKHDKYNVENRTIRYLRCFLSRCTGSLRSRPWCT